MTPDPQAPATATTDTPEANGNTLPPSVPPATERNLVDALVAELRRAIEKRGKRLSPKDVDLLNRIAARAIRWSIQSRIPVTDPTRKTALERQQAQVNAQLRNSRFIAATLTSERLWQTVDAVVTRLAAFAWRQIPIVG